jgi:hypothetical protein
MAAARPPPIITTSVTAFGRTPLNDESNASAS